MQSPEVVPVLDVHPPHEPVHGWRDFLLHLLTITIGLLIALSLEGLVEWQHHRHLVHEAEESLHREIAANAKSMQATLEDLHKEEQNLRNDVVVLKSMIRYPKGKDRGSMEISFHMRGFDNVSWKTAQSTGAFSYMPYADAQEYAEIYTTQDAIFSSEQQASRDAIISLAPFVNLADNDPDPTPEQANAIKEKIEVLQGQLLLVDKLFSSLDKSYKTFLAAHPD